MYVYTYTMYMHTCALLKMYKRAGMPAEIRSEDGSREHYQLAFGEIDNDGSKTIDLIELLVCACVCVRVCVCET